MSTATTGPQSDVVIASVALAGFELEIRGYLRGGRLGGLAYLVNGVDVGPNAYRDVLAMLALRQDR